MITDNQSPVISGLPSSINAGTDAGQCTAIVTWNPASVMENCTYTLSSNHNSGDAFPTGPTTVTYTATDASGNTTTSSFLIIVSDNEAPTISTCPSNVMVNSDAGVCTARTW